jgi:hypothetical protein
MSTAEPPRRITLTLPLPSVGSDVHFLGGSDPVAELIRAAGQELDRQRVADERARLSAIADIERAKNTRRARMARRLKKAMRLFR